MLKVNKDQQYTQQSTVIYTYIHVNFSHANFKYTNENITGKSNTPMKTPLANLTHQWKRHWQI
jgi:hypothetical protein